MQKNLKLQSKHQQNSKINPGNYAIFRNNNFLSNSFHDDESMKVDEILNNNCELLETKYQLRAKSNDLRILYQNAHKMKASAQLQVDHSNQVNVIPKVKKIKQNETKGI